MQERRWRSQAFLFQQINQSLFSKNNGRNSRINRRRRAKKMFVYFGRFQLQFQTINSERRRRWSVSRGEFFDEIDSRESAVVFRMVKSSSRCWHSKTLWDPQTIQKWQQLRVKCTRIENAKEFLMLVDFFLFREHFFFYFYFIFCII